MEVAYEETEVTKKEEKITFSPYSTTIIQIWKKKIDAGTEDLDVSVGYQAASTEENMNK